MKRLCIFLIVMCVASVAAVSAAPTKEDILAQYGIRVQPVVTVTGPVCPECVNVTNVTVVDTLHEHTFDLTKAEIVSQYRLNPIYLTGNSPTPIDHTVQSIHYDVMVLDGIDRGYIERSLDCVENKFYAFTIVPPDERAYRDTFNLLTFSYGTLTRGNMGHIWISRTDPPTEQGLGDLIEHECDHLIGIPTGHPGGIPSQEITSRYTEASKTTGEVTITRMTGSGTTSWTVYL